MGSVAVANNGQAKVMSVDRQMLGRQTLQTIKVDMPRVNQISFQLRQLGAEMIEIFPEREDLIQQAILALVTREHLLMWGTYGTGKSDLLTTLLGAIEGSTLFSIGLTAFTQETHLFGLPNPKIMREEGRYEYDPAGTLLDAHYAELDEILDASPALLRTLLGVTLEGTYKRGHQVLQAQLQTAFATTNGIPQEEIHKQPELAAVIDRFIFQAKVEYLKMEESRLQMYQKHLQRARPITQLKLDDVMYLADVVEHTSMSMDPYLIQAYDQVIQTLRSDKRQPFGTISDRRSCRLLHIVKASALLRGRQQYELSDLMAVRWGICLGGDDQQQAIFSDLVEPILEHASEELDIRLDLSQQRLIDVFMDQLPEVPTQCTGAQMIDLHRRLTKMRTKVEQIRPQLSDIQQQRDSLLDDIVHRLAQVDQMIDGQ